jgi:hypothetical protein
MFEAVGIAQQPAAAKQLEIRPAATGSKSECPAGVPRERRLLTVALRGQAKTQTGICNQSASGALTPLVTHIVTTFSEMRIAISMILLRIRTFDPGPENDSRAVRWTVL